MYDGRKLLTNIDQKGEYCEHYLQGDGGTWDHGITFRFLDKKGKVHTVHSSDFASLPLEVTEDDEKEYTQDIENIANNFFDYVGWVV